MRVKVTGTVTAEHIEKLSNSVSKVVQRLMLWSLLFMVALCALIFAHGWIAKIIAIVGLAIVVIVWTFHAYALLLLMLFLSQYKRSKKE